MDITARLRGKQIADVLCNGHVLQLRTVDGAEINIVWLGDDGKPLKGKPVAAQIGVRLQARGAQELAHYPSLQQKGFAS